MACLYVWEPLDRLFMYMLMYVCERGCTLQGVPPLLVELYDL